MVIATREWRRRPYSGAGCVISGTTADMPDVITLANKLGGQMPIAPASDRTIRELARPQACRSRASRVTSIPQPVTRLHLSPKRP